MKIIYNADIGKQGSKLEKTEGRSTGKLQGWRYKRELF